MTLAKMKQVYGELGEGAAEDVAVVFVSVDPERDTGRRFAGPPAARVSAARGWCR